MKLNEVEFDTFIAQLSNTLKSGANRGNVVKDFVKKRNANLKNKTVIFKHIDSGMKEFNKAIELLNKE